MNIKRGLVQLIMEGSLLLACPGLAPAQFTFMTNDDALTITGYTGAGGAVTIPSSTNGYPVTSIGQDAFFAAALTSVTIPNSVSNIGYEAFGDCESLTSVVMPEIVTNIGQYGFFKCTSLAAVTIPSGVSLVRVEAFGLCSSLATVTIPASVTNIQEGAFEDCTSLTKLYFLGNGFTPAMESFIGVTGATVYYLPGTTGWGATFAGFPAVLSYPALQISGAGIQTNEFGFSFSGTNDQVIVVEACTDLVNANWQPLQTNALSGTTFNFFDSQWSVYPRRFYRLRSP
jgi:hypothetical protein